MDNQTPNGTDAFVSNRTSAEAAWRAFLAAAGCFGGTAPAALASVSVPGSMPLLMADLANAVRIADADSGDGPVIVGFRVEAMEMRHVRIAFGSGRTEATLALYFPDGRPAVGSWGARIHPETTDMDGASVSLRARIEAGQQAAA